MDAAEAKLFDGYSATNAAIAAETLEEVGACDGTCEPYEDIFTFNRWRAQGFMVKKGEHGAKLAVLVAVRVKDEDTGEMKVAGRRPWTTTVFCRHQVKKMAKGDK